MRGTQILMHGNDKVCECKFDNGGYLQTAGGITNVYNEELLPVCIGNNNPVMDMKRWLLSRALAPNRPDIAPLREFYGGGSFVSAHGLSLFDTYWFAGQDFNDWDAVNAYDNWNCKKDSVVLMLKNASMLNEINYDSPNLTIPGSKQRIWYKGGNEIYMLYTDAQKEMSDYRAAGMDKTYVADRMYTILSEHICCKVKSCTSKDVEMIPLEEYYNVTQRPDRSNMENLQACCEQFGIPKWKTFFSEMMDYDEACENDDRSLADVGVLRDTKTLEIIGFAPL